MAKIYSVFLLLPSSRSSFLHFFPLRCLVSPLLAYSHYLLLMLLLNDFPSSGMDFPSLSSVQLLTSSFSPHVFQTSTHHSSIPPSHPSHFLVHFQVQPSRDTPQGGKNVVWAQTVCAAPVTKAGRESFAAQRVAATWSSSIPFSCETGKTLQSVYEVSER